MTTARILGLSITCAFLAACSHGDDSTARGIVMADSIVQTWIEADRIPGAVLRFSENGELRFERAYGAAQRFAYGGGQYPPSQAAAVEARRSGEAGGGIARLASPVSMTPETIFDLASLTKVMATTMAVMLLVDRGQLEIDEPVATYLPDFVTGGKSEITIRQLLTHRAGLYSWQPTYYHATDAAEAYVYIRDLPLNWPPGAERHYSDLGFMLLGLVVERISGQPLNDFLDVELYRPLGLSYTSFRPPQGAMAEPAPAGPFAATSHGNPFERRMVYDPDFGYRIGGDPSAWDGWRQYTLAGEVNDGNAFHAFGGVAGHAGLFSTAADLDALVQLLLDGGEAKGRRYFATEVVGRFLESTGEGQALGWQIPDYAPPTGFGHTGFTGTFVLGVRDRGLSVVLLTNRQNGGVDGATQYPDITELQRDVTLALAGAR